MRDTFILNSIFSKALAIALKTCLTIRGIMPDLSFMTSPMSPSIVWVLPEAVCPYAKMVPLNPSTMLSMMEEAE